VAAAKFADFIAAVAESAAVADRGEAGSSPAPLRSTLLDLVARGGIDFGLSNSSAPLAAQAEVIGGIAEECLSTAFVTWSHHMTTEYIDRFAAAALRDRFLPELLSGIRVGSTALATALADKSGKEPLPITFTEATDASGAAVFTINGVIPWASNLYEDTLIVFAARNETTEERVVFAALLASDGVAVKPAGELLALNATASGTVRFGGLELSAENVLSRDVDFFIGQMRPRFLVLQTSFCLGLVRASLAAIATAPSTAPFAADIAGFEARLAELTAKLDELAASVAEYPAPGNGRAPLEFLQTRLGAAELAQAVTRVELATIGGRGYYAASATSRRIRESLFLSVQAPTEGSLRWEISQLTSAA
jgi:alkylation response protein AidB-like acyl-CoA dehydrogenase